MSRALLLRHRPRRDGDRARLAPAAALAAACVLGLGAPLSACRATRGPAVAPVRPSFVLLLADDQAWNGTSVAMEPDRPDSRSTLAETPALERLAARGMVFSQAYAAAPSCSPSRASLLTGRSPAALHMTDILGGWAVRRQRHVRPLETPRVRDGLPLDQPTVAEILKQRAPEYVTAHLGKWHLGGGGPGAHGFDVHSGDTDNHDARGGPDDPKRVFELTDAAIDFLEERATDGRPFYLQISHWAVHQPQGARRETLHRVRQRAPGASEAEVALAASSDDLDAGLGRLLDALDRLDLASRTFVFYLSDNGAPAGRGRASPPLRGGKDTLYEGGLRVPMVVAGPTVPARRHSDVPTIGWDWLPTVAELAGLAGPLPPNVEGGSLAAVLRGEAGARVVRPRDDLVWHLPHYFPEEETTPVSALRSGPWKLLHFWEDGHDALYDLGRDLGESHDLAGEQPARAAELSARLREGLEEEGAEIPRPRSG